jgi:hypothetical protein
VREQERRESEARRVSAAHPAFCRHGLGVRTGIGGFKIDDVAKEDFSLVEFIAPDDDGLERKRALAQAGDHCLAAGFDVLGDRDFALAREEFHRTHFAQIHPHWVVGAVGRLLGLGLGWHPALNFDQFGAFGFCLYFGLLRLQDRVSRRGIEVPSTS